MASHEVTTPRRRAVAAAHDEATRTLLYWMDVEALTSPEAEEDRDTDARGSFEARHVPDRDFPWRDASFGHPDKRYRHFVRFGVFDREACEIALIRALSTLPAADYDTTPAMTHKRFGFAGVFAVDYDGMAVADSLVMPAFGFAFEELRAGRSADLDGDLDEFRRRMSTVYAESLAAYAGAGRQVDEAFVDGLREAAAETLTWLRDVPHGLPLAVVRSVVTSVFVEIESKTARRADGSPAKLRRERTRKAELPPVDSFYFEDIRLVLRALSRGNGGLATRLLAGTGEHVDCTDRAFVAQACTASTHPRARWPSSHDLSLMQQLAVDLATGSLADGGLFSVNGPPGTGTTPLLMDLIAAVIQRRAEALCAFRKPADAFERDTWTGPSGPVHRLHASLCDHLIVVASSNNAAVESLAKDLPSTQTIDSRYLDGLGLLTPAAEALLARSSPNGKPDPLDEDEAEETGTEQLGAAAPRSRAWGLISAVLGRASNRAHFTATLDRHGREGQPSPCNIFRLLSEARATMDWEAERAAFLRILSEVGTLAAEVCAAEDDGGAAAEAVAARIADLEEEIARLSAELPEASQVVGEAEADLAEISAAFEHSDRGVALIVQAKPAGLLALLRPGVTAQWRQDLASAAALRAEADRRLNVAQAARRAARRRRDDLEAAVDRATSALASARAEAARLVAATVSLATRHPGLVTVADVMSEVDAGRREQMLPGKSAALQDARARLFVAAMRVHLAFACAAGPDLFDRNLRTALAMLGGDRGKAVMEQAAGHPAEHLWATLALVTPVVSTTFASLPRTFTHMGAGSIPWLLVNEAGQAVPHQAIGAIWRARRAVIVGDRFQVEPVVTMDANADARLAERRGVPDRYRATLASVQMLADFANPFGTWVRPRGREPAWVGCPLKVHRRCAEPMFGIANRLAYGGLMVLADGKGDGEAALTRSRPLLGECRWIDVAAKLGGPKHFIAAQAQVVRQLVLACADRGHVGEDGLPALFVISPFRSMADGLRRILCDDLQALGHDAHRVSAWGAASIGTVHAFTGKERETVILALGGASDGAIKWVSATPNILNVAVTRAQRRLYIVGDRTRWLAASALVAELGGLPVEAGEIALPVPGDPLSPARARAAS